MTGSGPETTSRFLEWRTPALMGVAYELCDRNETPVAEVQFELKVSVTWALTVSGC